MVRRTDVFVSYKAEDRRRVVPLVAALEAEGFSIWWDSHIGAGAHWREDIQAHLDAAKCVVVAWSHRSVGRDGDFVRDEATRARKRGVYLPVRLDLVEPPLGFGEVQAISLKGWKGDRADPRFLALSNAIRRKIAGEDITYATLSDDRGRVSRRAIVSASAGGATILAAGGGWLLLRPTEANAKRIAVMPFKNLSGDLGQAYFAEGIAEELRGALTRIGLQVIGGASCDAVKDVETRTACKQLGVANLLTGSVRRSANLIRISAQLLRGSDGVEHWSESYDRAPGDVIKIQTDIASNVVHALRIALGHAALSTLTLGGTADAAAQDLFLRAKKTYAEGDDASSCLQSISLLDAALARDPNYADAWRERGNVFEYLASVYSNEPAERTERLGQGEAAAKRAIAIAPRLGSAHSVLAVIEVDRFEFPSAVQHMRRGVAISPDDPNTLAPASDIMKWFGNGREALQLADRLISLDPLNDLSFNQRGAVLFSLRRYREAIDACRRSLELAPKSLFPQIITGYSLLLMNRLTEAKNKLRTLPADDSWRLTGQAILAARSHDLAGAEQIIGHMRELFPDPPRYQFAQIYAQAGNADRAFAELDLALRTKDPALQQLRSDPFIDPIARDRRYLALLKQLNFPT